MRISFHRRSINKFEVRIDLIALGTWKVKEMNKASELIDSCTNGGEKSEKILLSLSPTYQLAIEPCQFGAQHLYRIYANGYSLGFWRPIDMSESSRLISECANGLEISENVFLPLPGTKEAALTSIERWEARRKAILKKGE